ncbi:MAG: PAS domain-containing protein [Pyrinomonadaceae bacterium]|nr:PAS domain-containing protein [Pyrinomonadaceae bacterium]
MSFAFDENRSDNFQNSHEIIMIIASTEKNVASQIYQSAKVLIIAVKDDLRDESRFDFMMFGGYQVFYAIDLVDATRQVSGKNFDLILLEAEVLSRNNYALGERLRESASYAPLIVFSFRADETNRETALEFGAQDFLDFNNSHNEIFWRLSFQRQNGEILKQNALRLREAEFIADLGKTLLVTLEPEQVVKLVSGALYEIINVAVCAAAADVSGSVPTVCGFNREGTAETDATDVYTERLKKWFGSNAAQSAVFTDNYNDFLLRDDFHRFEYVAPVFIGERIKGVLAIGFDRAEDCTPEIIHLVDAAAKMAALSIHITSLYEAALSASVYLAKEEQKRFTEAILDALPISLYAVDRQFRVVAWNKHRELGKLGIPRESAIGRRVFDVLPRQPREIIEHEFERAFVTGQIERVEQRTTDERGATKHWLVSKIPMRDLESGEVSHVISVGEDITARVEANYAVARAEKLAAVGRLAAGIVHEINNPLATIAACAEALETRSDEGVFGDSSDAEDLREYVNLIRDEAFRCKSITNGLLNFSRLRTGNRSTINLSEVLDSSIKLIKHQKSSANVEIRFEAKSDLPFVSADEGQIQQAIIALATNAIDAMPEGGTLTFKAFAKRQRVFIEIEDTGIGIPPENLTKIYEPFFTTKEVGQGTGLGLAVCYGIVTENGGSLNVRSTVGIGSTFTISLPIDFENYQRQTL